MRALVGKLAWRIANRLSPPEPRREWEIVPAEMKTTYTPTCVEWKARL